MVARHHDHADPRGFALLDGGRHLGAWGVDQRHHAHETQLCEHCVRVWHPRGERVAVLAQREVGRFAAEGVVGRVHRGIERQFAESEHAQSLARQLQL